MRRMRQLSWYHYSIGIVCGVAVGSISYFASPKFNQWARHLQQKATTPEAPATTAEKSSQKTEKLAEEHRPASQQEHPAGTPAGSGEKTKSARKPASGPTPELEQLYSSSGAGDPALCASIEFPGDGGAAQLQLSKADWARVMKSFHYAKDKLLSWLESRRAGIPADAYSKLEARVKDLRIVRPGPHVDPDLNWRGIGARTLDTQKEPILNIGSGFVKLYSRHPKRAEFEMVRLVAQSWAPCELKKAGLPALWTSYLSCMSIDEPGACEAGGYSEGGWAVSSALAAKVAPPGCTLPAFADAKDRQCLVKAVNLTQGFWSEQNGPEVALNTQEAR